MAYSYTQLEEIRDRVKNEVASVQNNLDSAKSRFSQIVAACDAISAQYGGAGGFVQQVNALATAHPNDAAVQALKASVDRMVSDFRATKTAAQAADTAVNG